MRASFHPTLFVLAVLSLPLGASCATTQSGLSAYKGHEYGTARATWEPLAREGDADAQFLLGTLYEEGRGVPPDALEAHEWYVQAAGQGHPGACTNLGLMYFDGKGVTQSFSKSMEWFERGVEVGSPLAMNNLGVMYLQGIGCRQDLPHAHRLFKASAELGHAMAQRLVAQTYEEGVGVRADAAEAAAWYGKAADQGDSEAQLRYGLLLTRQGADQELAAAYFASAAEQGVVDAQFLLGWMYFTGRGVEQNNDTALTWLGAAAEKGDALAQSGVALAFLRASNNAGSELSVEAAQWMRIAAEQDLPSAQHDLGLMYLRGQGVEPSRTEGIKWLRLAAANGHVRAAEKLSVIL